MLKSADQNYKVVSNYNLVLLQKEVNQLIDDGYDPIGGLTVSGDPTRGEEVFYQAMQILPVDELFIGTIDKPGRMVIPFEGFDALPKPPRQQPNSTKKRP